MNLKNYTTQERGRAASLGRTLGIPSVLISQWANGIRQVPAERCPEIEKSTAGIVTCEDLRPDVDWAYLRGTRADNACPPGKTRSHTTMLPDSSLIR
ncbi:transcriptional regulator [Candidatus Symbiopectobacterium endolongispinus]|uniref:transcriptional regulator n=1 Tax=Candidatus Symbiopectobacterium endolongispinus TaxID=2812664 RepID=UPI002079EF22|nr:helix-turn-helix domain-containing protein [Candidatus Symbiopectobacterium endolongispinus]MBT9428913.1 helix-turn-helix domain-containing protein [Candidatus Symbiopectobacterium endolongispinus]